MLLFASYVLGIQLPSTMLFKDMRWVGTRFLERLYIQFLQSPWVLDKKYYRFMEFVNPEHCEDCYYL